MQMMVWEDVVGCGRMTFSPFIFGLTMTFWRASGHFVHSQSLMHLKIPILLDLLLLAQSPLDADTWLHLRPYVARHWAGIFCLRHNCPKPIGLTVMESSWIFMTPRSCHCGSGLNAWTPMAGQYRRKTCGRHDA